MVDFETLDGKRILIIANQENEQLKPKHKETIHWMKLKYADSTFGSGGMTGVTLKTFYDYQLVIFTPDFLDRAGVVEDYLWKEKFIDTINLILSVGGVLALVPPFLISLAR
jgi:hypothetical protein